MGLLQIMDRSGHTEITWSKDDPESVEAARKKFDELRSQGFLLYAENAEKPDQKGEVLTAFDPDIATKIIAAPPSAGG